MKKIICLLLVLGLAACSKPAETPNEPVEATGTAEVVNGEDKTTAEVTLVDGKITKVYIDATKDGKSKKELGADYNMAKASAIGKEWFEQIEHLEEKLVGTDGTIELDDAGKAVDADIVSGCTIGLADVATAVADAVANAK